MNGRERKTKSQIRQQYGHRLTGLLSKTSNAVKKIARLQQQIIFLKTCLGLGFIPYGFYLKNHFGDPGLDFTLQRTSFILMKKVVGLNYGKLHQLDLEVDWKFLDLKRQLARPDFEVVANWVDSDYWRESQKEKRVLTGKLERLKLLYGYEISEIWPNKTFRNSLIDNYTETLFSESQLDILALGHKFNLTPKKIPTSDFIAAVDQATETNPDILPHRNKICTTVARMLRRQPYIQPNLSPEHQKAVKDLQKMVQSGTVKITRADKGEKTVILSPEAYHDKCMEHLNDQTVYKPIRRSLLSKTHGRIHSVLQPLVNVKRLLFSEKQKLNPSKEKVRDPYFYGLVKTHKINKPLRPIVSNRDTVAHPMAKYLAQTLSSLLGLSPTHLWNSMDFKSNINEIEFPKDATLASFDVSSLFTNVSVDRALVCLHSRLIDHEDLWDDKTFLKMEELMELVEICATSTYFLYITPRNQRQFYKQIKGLAMGSSLSPILAGIFMEFFESLSIPRAPVSILIWVRYVDDIFLVVKGDGLEVQVLLAFMNTQDETGAIQFTSELEREGKLPYLDCDLTKIPSKEAEVFTLDIDIYRKPTSTDRLVHWKSSQPPQQKLAIVSCLGYRAKALCSNPDLEMDRLSQVFRKNGYNPVTVNSKLNPPPGVKPRPLSTRISLPYIPKVSERISRYFKQYHIEVVSKKSRTLGSLLMKNSPPDREKKNVVYQIPCKDCPKLYIGESERFFSVRLEEHKSAMRKQDMEKSACVEHALNEGHTINFAKAAVIDSTSAAWLLSKKESLHIISNSKSINRTTEKNVHPEFLKLFKALV